MRLRNTWRLTYSPEQDQDIESALSDAVAQTHIARVSPRASGAAILTRNYYTLHQRCLARFCHGRTLFIGDAAHLNSPAGGMGMNSGIHDARSLADHLVPVINGDDPSLLERLGLAVSRIVARRQALHFLLRDGAPASIVALE